MKLKAADVDKIFKELLYHDNEIAFGEPIVDPVIAQGVMMKVGFHPRRLEKAREVVKAWLMELPEQFQRSKGGGWSFLNMCMTKDGDQWGEHSHIDQLVTMGIALKLASFALPREMWHVLPGQMPYITIEDA